VKRLGRYWCFYSGGAWTGPGYGVSFAVADTPLGPWRESGTEGPAFIRTRAGIADGPGHNSLITAPNGDDYVVYHAWDPEHRTRRMCIDRVWWTPDGPRTDGPTTAPQPVPGRLEG
jgi:hypothetical protein